MPTDATRWIPEQIHQWRREHPGKDPDRYLTLGDPHTPLGGRRWDAAYGPLPQQED